MVIKRTYLFSITAFLLFLFTIISPNQTPVLANNDFSTVVTKFEINNNLTTGQESFSDISIVNNNLYVSDKNLPNKILYYDLDNPDINNELLLNDNYYPTNIVYNYYTKEFYFSDSLTFGIKNANSNTDFKDYYQNDSPDADAISMQNIFDCAISMNGTVFALTLNSNNNSIIVYKTSQSERFYLLTDFSESDILKNFTLNSKSRIVCDIYGDNIWFTINNQIFQYNIEQGIVNNSFKIPELENYDQIIDIKTDHLDNLILFIEKATGQIQFVKCNTTDEPLIYTDNENKIKGNGFAIDFENGIIYTFTDNEIFEIKIYYGNNNFLNEMKNLQDVVDWENLVLTSTLDCLTPIKSSITLYPYNNLYKSGIEISCNMILIQEIKNSMFDFVLINSLGTKNLTGYVLKEDVFKTTEKQIGPNQVSPIFTNTAIYRYPSSLLNDNDNEVIITTIKKISQNEPPIFTVLSSTVYPTDNNNVDFYAIQYGDIIGYVDKNSVIDVLIKPLDRIFVGNAETKNDIQIYSDYSLSIKSYTLNKNTKVQIESTTNGVSKIYWLNDDIVFVGYTQSTNLNDGTLSTTQLIGIILMASTLLIAIIIICIGARIHKKNKNKLVE